MATQMYQPLDRLVPENSDYERNDVRATDLNQSEPSWDQIAAEAYEVFKNRGDRDGSALEDWLEAERRLRERAFAVDS
jgi:hypothetical protein